MNGTIENLKGLVATLREGIIVLVLLLFLLLPGAMSGVLERAGFTKASIAGFEWERLRESATSTEAAVETVTALEARLDAFGERLSELGRSASAPPAVKQQITALSREVASSRSDTRKVQDALQESLAAQRSVIRRADPGLLREGRRPDPADRR